MLGKKKTDKEKIKKEEQEKASAKKPGVIKKSLKWAFKPFANFSGWVGYDIVRDSSRYMVDVTKEVISPAKAAHEEDFVTAIERLGLKEEDLEQKVKDMMRLCIIYVVIASLILLYALYNAFSGAFFAFFFSLILAMIAMIFAFRFHFWVFQIQHRKLGCTFKEWYTSQLEEEHHEK